MLQTPLLALAFAFAGGTQTIHVDPNIGVDLPGYGSLAQPVKSITFAFTQLPTGYAADLRLHPGTYSESSGEVFPIICVPDTTITSVVPAQAHVKKEALAISTVFQIPAGSQQASFSNLTINTFDRGITADAESEDILQLTVDGCEISASQAFVVTVVDGSAYVTVQRSVMNGGDTSVNVNTEGAGYVDVKVLDCTLRGMRGYRIVSTGPTSLVTSLARQVIFDKCSMQGLSAVATGGGVIDDVVEGCAFFKNAPKKANPGVGAMTELVNSGGFATHFISNCAFDGNGKELPNYDPSHWTLQSNFLQDPNLCSIATNYCGLPGFVDATNGDFHLSPTSPAIDAGVPSNWTAGEDLDGDPRFGHPFLVGVAALDIGPDESYSASLHARPNPSELEKAVKFRLRGPSGSFAVLVFSAATNGVGFSDGLRVAFPLLIDPVVIGVMPATPGGVADLAFSTIVPPLPVLLDLVLYEQAIFATGSTIGFGYNVVEHRFR